MIFSYSNLLYEKERERERESTTSTSTWVSDPPFTAHIGNLSYNIDPKDVYKFFDALNVKNIRLPREGDPESGRLRGFGFVDFEDRQSLIGALSMNDHILKDRKIRINLANQDGNKRSEK